jgi:hypothetical protein
VFGFGVFFDKIGVLGEKKILREGAVVVIAVFVLFRGRFVYPPLKWMESGG